MRVIRDGFGQRDGRLRWLAAVLEIRGADDNMIGDAILRRIGKTFPEDGSVAAAMAQ
jgi:hypothetical protein